MAAEGNAARKLGTQARVLRAWFYVTIARAAGLCIAPLFIPALNHTDISKIIGLGAVGLVLDVLLSFFGRVILGRKHLAGKWLNESTWRVTLGMMFVSAVTFTAAALSALTSDVGDAPDQVAFALAMVGVVIVTLFALMPSRAAGFATCFGLGLTTLLLVDNLALRLTVVAVIVIMLGLVRVDAREQAQRQAERDGAVTSQERALAIMGDFESAGRGWFWETDRHGNLAYLSVTVAEKFDVPVTDLLGEPFTDLIRKRGGNADSEDRTLGFSLSSRTPFKDLNVQAAVKGEERWWSISGNPISNEYGHFIGFRGSGTDLTDVKRSEREIKQLARYDTLTGLANRLHINDILERALRNHFGQPQACALFLMDLDRFKAVNDTLGHPVGDQLLQQVAGRLRNVVGDKGQVGRLGGDEFQIVFPQITNTDALGAIAQAIILAMAKPFAIENEQVRIGCSVGIAIATTEPVPAAALVRNADLALYAAKDAGRGVYRFYADEMHNQASERKALEDALRDALARNQFELYYQPIVDIRTERISGFEALIRWHHPQHGMVSPAKFIPIAEDSGLIIPIGDWIIRSACETLKQMGTQYRVAVNVSPRQFTNPALPTTIINAVAAAGVRQQQLELEITEGVFLDESEANIAMFRKLQNTGVRLALDDFGTGYSALGYLKKAPFNKIKIDQSFVRGAAVEGNMNSAIISSIVSLGGALNMETTAEGVETHDELELIRGLGCTHVQGFIYGAPMTREAALNLLRTGGGRVVASGYKSAREPRKRTLRTVALYAGGYKYEGKVRNVSSRGAMIEGLWNVPENTRFRIELAPGYVVDATTRWSIENRMGVKFDVAIDSEALASATLSAARQTQLRMAS